MSFTNTDDFALSCDRFLVQDIFSMWIGLRVFFTSFTDSSKKILSFIIFYRLVDAKNDAISPSKVNSNLWILFKKLYYIVVELKTQPHPQPIQKLWQQVGVSLSY